MLVAIYQDGSRRSHPVSFGACPLVFSEKLLDIISEK
jgi:hypothetical protein